jgi:PAS domain S-box-containing protein
VSSIHPGLLALRTAFEQLRQVLDELGVSQLPPEQGQLLVDSEGRVVYVTPRLEQMLGLEVDALLGAPVEALAARLESVGLETVDPRAATARFRRQDGGERVLRHRSVSLTGSDGSPAGTLYTFQDVTAAHERTRELADKKRELEEVHRRLTRAQHLKALGELAAEVAHEFGNLLQAIGLQSAALRRQTALPEPVVRSAWSIKQAVDLGHALTRRLLTFARNDPAEHMEPLDVGRIVRDIVQLLEPRIHRSGHPLRVDLSLPALPAVRGNPNKLTEAFLNLVLNALDAMPEGGLLQVTAVERSGEIRLAIRDTGTGMTPDQVARAFDPFFTTKPSGTGLGLSTVYGVVRAHGGSVFLESEPGRGTTVCVSLPTGSPLEVRRARATGRPRREADRVLVVDDHPAVREATSELLAAQGYVVESAGTVADALKAIEGHRFTVVVTDVGLPDRPGWEVARAAKLRSSDTVVVLVSGWGSHFSAEDARARGVDLVFEKPVDPDVLLAAIDQGIKSTAA